MKRLITSALILLCLAAAVFAQNAARPVMVPVRGGTFFMGSNENRVTEKVHEVTVRPFLMSETGVTQELYAQVMNENPSVFKGEDFPVDSVSWFDAVRFCNALSARSGLPPAYVIDGNNVTWDRESKGFRLPTEAEWEFAARGGIHGASGPQDKVFFSGGDAAANPQDYCWFAVNSKTSSRAVKGKLPNQLGLYDMSGNVWEWCWDWYADYPDGPVSDYTGPATGNHRVYRGGSFFNNQAQLRAAFRIWDPPSAKANSRGFRIVQNG
jgi:formylglycine-generating enzyme required for sulfatase activity